MNKKILITACVVLTIGITGNIIKNTVFAESNSDTKQTFDSNDIKNIHVKGDNQRVLIEESNSDEIRVVLTNEEKEEIHAEVKDDTLEIEVERKINWFHWPDFDGWFDNQGSTVTVYLPDKQFDEINLEVDNGRILAEDIHADNVVMKTDNGRIEAEDITSEHTNLTTDNGVIKIDDVTGELVVKTNNGTIDAEIDSLDRNIKAESDNGKINIAVDNTPTNVLFDVDVDNGSVNILDNRYEDNDKIGNGDNLVSLSTNNGKITVKQD